MMDAQQKRMAEELLFTGEEKPSFAKLLYFGLFDADRVFPYPRPTDVENQAILKNLTAFIETQIDPDWIDRHAEIPDSVIKGLGELGLLSMTIPKEYGGLGTSQFAYCKAMEQLARRCSATALFVNAHQSIGLKALLLFGTELQKETWLKQLASGDKLAAFSLTEPNAGSDASGVETRAEFDPVKKAWVINGRKQWTTNGAIADILTVMAKTNTDGQDRITAFLVTPKMTGFKVRDAALEKVGMRGSKTANLQFENLEVPEENVLGAIGKGLKVCLTVLDYGRTTFGATCTGTAKYALEKAIAHAKTRIQFKQPLAAFPLIKEKIAAMSSLVYAMEATTYLTAGILDSGEEDIMLEAAILKVFASESLWYIIYETMQIYGGRSFFTDEPLERMMRDARLNMIGEGANEVLRAFIGVVGMRDVGMQLKTALDAMHHPLAESVTLSKFIHSVGMRLKLPDIPVKSDKLKDEARELAKTVRRFGWSIVRLLAAYREEVLEKQLCLNRIAESAIGIYTSTAVLSKLDSQIAENVSDIDEQLAVGKFYIRQALHKVKISLDALFDNEDGDIEYLSDLVTGRKT